MGGYMSSITFLCIYQLFIMSCIFGNYDLTDVTATIDCCSLYFKGTTDGKYLFVFNLVETIAIDSDDNVIIKDGESYLNINASDLTALGLSTDIINTSASLCRCSGAANAPSFPGENGVVSGGIRMLCTNDVSGNPIPHLVETMNDIDNGAFVSYRVHYIGVTGVPPEEGVQDLLRFFVCDGFNETETEGLTLNPYCDDDGAITGYTAIIIDENSNLVQTLYFDATQTEVATPPTGSPCNDELTVNCPTCI